MKRFTLIYVWLLFLVLSVVAQEPEGTYGYKQVMCTATIILITL